MAISMGMAVHRTAGYGAFQGDLAPSGHGFQSDPSPFKKDMTSWGVIIGCFVRPENSGMKCKIEHSLSPAGLENAE
jgi:hypothetical protein